MSDSLLHDLEAILSRTSAEDLACLELAGSRELEKRDAEDHLSRYRPYPKQLEFHAAGTHYRERMLMAANQVGKTLAAAMETAMHLTGRYQSDWPGKRFDRPVRWIAGSESSELTKKGVQRLLLGNPEDESSWGTGAIPKDALVDWQRRQSPVPNCVGTITVRHESGGTSSVQLQAYEQGRSKWQADTIDGIWFDEEPPEDIYFEGLTRTNTTFGPVYVTLTPLQGISKVVGRYYKEKAEGTHLTMMTIEDAHHYSPEQRAAICATYPEYEREARTRGIPQLGEGRIFTVAQSAISVAAMPIPDHWPRICGLDFGWDHPTAAVQLAWDRDADTIYVTHEHRERKQAPALFVAGCRWGDWPWAWPHDGNQSGGKFGLAEAVHLKTLYAQQGLKMLPEPATFEDGGNGVEAGVQDMLERMQTGRFRVFHHLTKWFEEFNLYHRKDGLIVKENDDLICATRYALMMRRFAKTPQQLKTRKQALAPEMAPHQYGWMRG